MDLFAILHYILSFVLDQRLEFHINSRANIFSSFSHNVKFWKVIQHNRKDVGENGEQVH